VCCFSLKTGRNWQTGITTDKHLFPLNPKNHPPGNFEGLGVLPLVV
jgi:hypothetical protein